MFWPNGSGKKLELASWSGWMCPLRPRLPGRPSQVPSHKIRSLPQACRQYLPTRTNALPPNEVALTTPNNPAIQYVGVLLKS